MTRSRRLATTGWGLALVVFLGWGAAAHAAANGTLQQRLLTFSDTATNTLTFTVATGLAADEAASILLDFTTDGSAALPSAEPFPTPASVTFAFTYAGTPLPALNFNASQAAGAGFTASSGVATPNVTLSATKPGSSFGRYVLTLTFPAGAAGLSSNWTLAIAGVPTSPVIRATAYIDNGKFGGLAVAGPCGGGSSGTCPPGQTCKGPCPLCPPVSICKLRPQLCEIIVWYPTWWKWPPPGPNPCLSCPEPWNERFGEEFERTLVTFTPLQKGGEPLGEGRAKEIQMNIAGATAVGPVFDMGGGAYAQMLQSRKGEASPRLSATIAGVKTDEIIAGTVASNPQSPLTMLLSILLLLALALLAAMTRRARAATKRQG